MNYTKTAQTVAKDFKTNLKNGLNESSILVRRQQFGKNEMTPQKRKSFIKRLIEALSEPTLLILEFAWVVTLGVNLGKFLKNGKGDFLECIGIFVAVILSATLTLIMEGRSQKAFELLGKVYDKISVKVIRDGKVKQVCKEDVVCGDLICLESGDKIIADGRVVESNFLKIDESTLTGESNRVEKFADKIYSQNTPIAERKNMVYSGTFVCEGSGKMIVTAVGDSAELGKIAVELNSSKNGEAPLSQKLNRLGKTVTLVGGIVSVFVFILSLIRLAILKDLNFFTVQDAFLGAIVLIVAAVPEGLPATAAISLSLNVVKLAKSNALIKKLVAAETSGAVSVICSDKTGTLTQNDMRVESLNFSSDEKRDNLLANAVINSSATLKGFGKNKKVFGSATEGALLIECKKYGWDYEKCRDKRLIGRVLPFNSAKKYMATEYLAGQGKIFFKGAPEIIVESSNLSKQKKDAVLLKISTFQKQGKRVIAFSSFCGEWDGENIPYSKTVYDGFAVISDPVRRDVKKSVELCKNAGICVMMMTGDNKETATSIAKELNIITSESQVVLADFIDGLDVNSLKKIIKGIKVVARSTPTTKLKIVETLKSLGEVVAVTGDGVNDAPAIERADIGISMGSGSEITKEASDIVLLDDSFSTIVKAISFGRNIYSNFQRFITFQLTVNITAMIVVVVSLIVGLENPFTSVQLLWIDIIMDGPPALTLAMEKDKGEFMTRRPVKRSDAILTKTMCARILFQGCFMAFVIIMEYLYDFLGAGVNGVSTAVFCLFVIFQLFNAFNCRKIGSESIFSGFADNKLMLCVFSATFLFQIIMTQFLGGFFMTVPLPIDVWLKIIGVCLFTIVFSETYKLFYRILKNQKIFIAKKRRNLN